MIVAAKAISFQAVVLAQIASGGAGWGVRPIYHDIVVAASCMTALVVLVVVMLALVVYPQRKPPGGWLLLLYWLQKTSYYFLCACAGLTVVGLLTVIWFDNGLDDADTLNLLIPVLAIVIASFVRLWFHGDPPLVLAFRKIRGWYELHRSYSGQTG